MSPLTLLYSAFPPSIHLGRVDTYNHSHTGRKDVQNTQRETPCSQGFLSFGSFLQRNAHLSTVYPEVNLSDCVLTIKKPAISKQGIKFINQVYYMWTAILCLTHLAPWVLCVIPFPLITSSNWSSRFFHANYFLPNQIWMDWRNDNHTQWMDLQGT